MISVQTAIVHAALIMSIIILDMALAYLSARYTEHYESLMPRSKIIMDNRRLYALAGLPGKIMRTGTIAMTLLIPRLYTKRKLVEVEEIEKFPQKTKRLLVSVLLLHPILLTGLAIASTRT